jgi:hypothetical protein
MAPIGRIIKYIVQRDRTIITNYSSTAEQLSFDFWRLPIPPTPKRDFESCFDAQDQVTFEVDVTGFPAVEQFTIGGKPAGYTLAGAGGRTWLQFKARPFTTPGQVAITFNTSSNSAPTLPSLTDTTLVPGMVLRVVNTGTDPDLPQATLSYQLLQAPTGATIDANGVITWSPDPAQIPSTNLFRTVAIDDGTPALSATNAFTVFVLNSAPPLQITSIDVSDGLARVTWNAAPGWSYRLQHKNALVEPWTDASEDVIPTGWIGIASQVLDTAPWALYRVIKTP